MWKKGVPAIAMSALLLGACSMTDDRALPRNNETPMDEIDGRERNWTPDVQEERRGGSDLDGIEREGEKDDQYMNRDRPNSNNDIPGVEQDNRESNRP